MLIKHFANSSVRTHPLQNKNTCEFLRGSYSDHFQWFAQAESTAGFQSWLSDKNVYCKISFSRKTYSVGQVF